MQTKIIGSSNQGAIAPAELAIDPLFLAARVVHRPYDYTGAGRVLGFYRAAGISSAIAPAANGIMANMRYGDTTSFLVLLRLRVGISVVTAVTAQSTPPMVVAHARAYTASETTSIAALTLTGNNAKMRTTPMNSSQVAQFALATVAAGVTGGTKTLDTSSFGIATISPALGAIGSGTPMFDIYKADNNGGHPVVYGGNEGFALSWGSTTLATGTVTVAVEAEWAEVIVF